MANLKRTAIDEFVRALVLTWVLVVFLATVVVDSFLGGDLGEPSAFARAWFSIDLALDGIVVGVAGLWIFWRGWDRWIGFLGLTVLGLGLAVASSPMVVDGLAQWKTSEHPLSAVLRLFVLTVIAPQVLCGRDYRLALWAWVGMGTLLALSNFALGLEREFLGYPLFYLPASGVFGEVFAVTPHKNVLGSLIYCLPAFVAAWGLTVNRGWQRGVFGGLFLVLSVQVLTSRSQSAQLSWFVALVPLWWGRVRGKSVWLGVGGIVLFLGGMGWFSPDLLWEAISAFGLHTREAIWGDAFLEMGSQGNWWKGSLTEFHPMGTHPHNILLHYLLYHGLFGLVAYLAVLGIGFWISLRAFSQRFSTPLSQVILFSLVGGYLLSLVTGAMVSARSGGFVLFWFLMGQCIHTARNGVLVGEEFPTFFASVPKGFWEFGRLSIGRFGWKRGGYTADPSRGVS